MPPCPHTLQESLFCLVDPRSGIITQFHIAERARKIRVELDIEDFGNVGRQLRERNIAVTAFAVEQIDQFRQIRLAVLPRQPNRGQRIGGSCLYIFQCF